MCIQQYGVNYKENFFSSYKTFKYKTVPKYRSTEQIAFASARRGKRIFEGYDDILIGCANKSII